MVRAAAPRLIVLKASPEGLRQTKWHEYGARFLFGGAMTAAAGLIANHFGPAIGGLFLAFPARATFVEKHERQKKEEKGLHGSKRGRQAAAADATGTAMGSVGLLVFAFVVWEFVPRAAAWLVIPAATALWVGASILIWWIWKRKPWRNVHRLLTRAAPCHPAHSETEPRP